MENKLNSIKLIIEDIQNQVTDENNYLNSIKNENIKCFEKLVDKINNYTSHDWNTGYGIKHKKDALNTIFEIILEQNKRISKLEELINSTSTDMSFPNTEDDDPGPRELVYYDNNNPHDSKGL